MKYIHLNRRLQIARMVVVCVAFASLLLMVPAYGQERIPGLSTGLTFGAAEISKDDFGTGLSARAFAEYAPFIHEIAIRLSAGYLRFEDYVELGKYPFNSKDRVLLEDAYATLGVVYRFSRGRFVPFATANLGLYRYQKDDVYPAAGPIINGTQYSPYSVVQQNRGTDLGFNFGGGLEYFMGDDISMSAELLLHSIQGEVNSEVLDLTVSFRFLPQ